MDCACSGNRARDPARACDPSTHVGRLLGQLPVRKEGLILSGHARLDSTVHLACALRNALARSAEDVCAPGVCALQRLARSAEDVVLDKAPARSQPRCVNQLDVVLRAVSHLQRQHVLDASHNL